MLSDPSCNTLPFDIPILPDSSTPRPQEDPLAPLNFDDLLDIAREFEFTRTITHIWPCEEEPSTCPESRLDDILAAIVSAPNAEGRPIPLPSSVSLMTVDPVHVKEADSHRLAPECHTPDANACTSTDFVSLPNDEDQVGAEMTAPITWSLQGWSPPDGSEFLDLDVNHMFPQAAKDAWNSPLLAMFLSTPSTQPVDDINQSFAAVPSVGDVQPQTSIAVPKFRPTSTTNEIANGAGKRNVQTSRRNILEPVQARSAAQPTSKVTSQTIIASQAKASRPRSARAVCGTSTAKYVRAPRGGIPPHIARSVTRANILRIEKERKVMQDAFSNTATGQAKKPSVLRKTSKVDMETSKNVDNGGNGKVPFDLGEKGAKEGRTAKRAKYNK
ncbi:hypothetical protein JVT61DRAFT_8590 [Boletus reticuloceps]|uniref:Uncharacterized protein n=1 Tax=Boletus reticuloceps TaxID=495285 RepID=A0A8I3AFH6_9AGAM|nr:hypothetical protein JVT61DRAFT_8590 [Boletus reticuloceps]